jgi:hypothetical protein
MSKAAASANGAQMRFNIFILPRTKFVVGDPRLRANADFRRQPLRLRWQ